MEDKLHSFLADWTVNFVRNKDILLKKIQSIEKNKAGFDIYVKYKDKEQFFIIAPKIPDTDSIISKLNKNSRYSIITLNSKQNLDALVKSWSRLAGFRSLNVMFVNPFSETEKKWIICPYVHDKICDQGSLKTGLKSIFESVEPIEEEQIAAKIN